jgi:hypothetical protein
VFNVCRYGAVGYFSGLVSTSLAAANMVGQLCSH